MRKKMAEESNIQAELEDRELIVGLADFPYEAMAWYELASGGARIIAQGFNYAADPTAAFVNAIRDLRHGLALAGVVGRMGKPSPSQRSMGTCAPTWCIPATARAVDSASGFAVRYENNGPGAQRIPPGPGPPGGIMYGGWEAYRDFPTREDLLEKYERKPVTHYRQFDAFVGQEPGDYLVVPDEDGDALFVGHTYELMAFDQGVRVLVSDAVSLEAAERALSKIIAWIKEDPFGEWPL
jgi:hypothetical protein